MARYHATVESRRSATEAFGHLATFSNAAERDAGVLAGEQLHPGPADARPARMPAAVDARDRPQHRTQVWDHLAAATGTDSPELAQAGRDSVAAARSSLRGGRDDRVAAA